MPIDSVNGVLLKHNGENFYFEISSTKPIGNNSFYSYALDTTKTVSIPIVNIIKADCANIHTLNLGDKVFNTTLKTSFGTMGCLVKKIGSPEQYLLTCCHNVMKPIMHFTPDDPVRIAGSDKLDRIGQVTDAVRDNEIDAALIRLTDEAIKALSNIVPSMGTPQQPVDVGTEDINKKDIYFYGAASQKNVSGSIIGVLSDVKIRYWNAPEKHTFLNLIVASKNGQGLSQPGDSGSCVLDSNNKVVGIVLGGSDAETYIIPITTIMKKLSIQLIQNT